MSSELLPPTIPLAETTSVSDDGLIVASAGATFSISSRNGDIHPRTTQGFYAHDTRFLSAFLVRVHSRPLAAVGADILDHYIATFYAANDISDGVHPATLSVVRDRVLGQGLHEDIHFSNFGSVDDEMRVEVFLDADFADIFQVRMGTVHKAGQVTVETANGERHLALEYRRGSFKRETWIRFSEQPVIDGKTALFEVTLKPKGTWRLCVDIAPVADEPPPRMTCPERMLTPPFLSQDLAEQPVLTLLRKQQERLAEKTLPRLDTDYRGLDQVYAQALSDLQALRMQFEPGKFILAAGIPWFVAVFGRDSIISSIQTKLLGHDLMEGTLQILAKHQATQRDAFREAQPGKILHEVRAGEMSHMEEVPHSSYYGTVDATPLYIRLLWEAYQWTGDSSLLGRFFPAAEAAMKWIDKYGDLDGDGFVEYNTKTQQGLRNQGWKDSYDSIAFRDGRLAEGPIALVEVQGYVYDAKRKMSDLYMIQGNSRKARALEKEAETLRQAFEDAFWMPEEGYYAMALDAEKKQVDGVGTNPGHCLWSGIISPERARLVVQRLMAPDMFSGWGLRTLSAQMSRFNPLSYHNGSVWPHDNSIVASGMARYGYGSEARRVALAMIDAAVAFPKYRLPELCAGYPRRELSFPVPYPAANAPQAWASGAIIYFLETLLGVIPAGEHLLQEAPQEGVSITLSGVPYRGTKRVL